MGLSPGLDFEARLFAKPNAAALLERELSAPGYLVKPIAIGTNTDPYQPIERTYQIMREVLEVLDKTSHPVTIVTKSALVLRDRDILARMAKRNLVKVGVSITTLDPKLARAMEPRAATPARRLEALKGLHEVGVPVMVMVAPIIPAINDAEIEQILAAAKYAGACSASYVLLRLPLEVTEIFKQWLNEHYPDRYRHVMSLIRSMRDGKDYDSDWNVRMRGTGPYAMLIRQRFAIALKRLGLQSRTRLATEHFTPPRGGAVQLTLF
jgi:DNA repair photolyase